MKRFSKVSILLLVVVASILLASCATPNLSRTQVFLAADTEFTKAVEQYNHYYTMADKETQVQWKKEIDPLILDVDEALSVWEASLNTEYEANKYAVYLRLKTLLFKRLLEISQKQGKEG